MLKYPLIGGLFLPTAQVNVLEAGLPDDVNKLATFINALCFSLYLVFVSFVFLAALIWFGLIIQEIWQPCSEAALQSSHLFLETALIKFIRLKLRLHDGR